MTDAEVMAELRSSSLLNRVRQIFSNEAARIHQAGAQPRLGPIEIRAMEFEAARKLIDYIKGEV